MLVVCACGGAVGSGSRLRVGSAQGRASAVSHRAAPPWQSPVVHEPAYLNDGDHESPLDADGDYLEDEDSDSRFHENSRYHDADDRGFMAYGRTADAGVVRLVRGIVKRYYRTAAAHDGSAACRELVPHIARSAPVDYGVYGPAYLHGARSCATALTRLFEHSTIDFSASIEVTDVRVNGNIGLALIGSRTAPPAYLVIERERGRWWVGQVLAQTMN
jgi:hypothetical protein